MSGVGEKRKETVLVDPVSRAQALRHQGQMRIDLDLIGFYGPNRGGLGVSGFHSPEVLCDFISNKIRVNRYHAVDLVEVPQAELEQFRQYNRAKCEDDALMPIFSDGMCYAALTKTHFSHACKLSKEKNRSLFNEGEISVKPLENDVEWQDIVNKGPICNVYSAQLLQDHEALHALMNTDNLNAQIEMTTDEVQLLGRIHSLVEADAKAGHTEIKKSMDAFVMRVRALGPLTFSDGDIAALTRFRMGIASNVNDVFMVCHFAMIQARIRVRPKDFACIATVDVRAQWLKVAVCLRQYLSALNEKAPIGPKAAEKSFSGRAEVFARRLSEKGFEELNNRPVVVLDLERTLRELIRHYKGAEGNGDATRVLRARGRLLSDFGRLAIAASTLLERTALKGAAGVPTPEKEVAKYLSDLLVQGRVQAEEKHASLLLEAGSFTAATLPVKKYPKPPAAGTVAGGPSAAPSKDTATSTDPLRFRADDAEGVLTEMDVFKRLHIDGVGNIVGVRRTVSVKTEGAEGAEGKHGVVVSEGVLQKIEVPSATVLIDISDGETQEITVNVDELVQAKPKVKDAKASSIDAPELVPLDKATEKLNSFDVDLIFDSYMESLCRLALAQGMATSWVSSGGVQAHVVSAPNKFPLATQLRATDDFKKWDLSFTPYTTHLISADSAEAAKLKNDKTVHPSLQQYVVCTVRGTQRRGKTAKAIGGESADKGDVAVSKVYYLVSPMLDAKSGAKRETCLANLSPFWCAPRTQQSSMANLICETQVVEIPLCAPVGAKAGTLPKVKYTIEFPVIWNSRKVNAGESLAISCMES